jgi:hypothetical protein
MNTTGKKFGGRTKGTENKTTAEIRQMYQQLISDNLEQLQSDIDSLDPLQRLKVIIELSKFVVPSLKQQEVVIESPAPINMINLGRGLPQEKAEQIMREELRTINNDLESRY